MTYAAPVLAFNNRDKIVSYHGCGLARTVTGFALYADKKRVSLGGVLGEGVLKSCPGQTVNSETQSKPTCTHKHKRNKVITCI